MPHVTIVKKGISALKINHFRHKNGDIFDNVQ